MLLSVCTLLDMVDLSSFSFMNHDAIILVLILLDFYNKICRILHLPVARQKYKNMHFSRVIRSLLDFNRLFYSITSSGSSVLFLLVAFQYFGKCQSIIWFNCSTLRNNVS